jgi:cytochrome b
VLFYVVLIVMPMTGWLASSAAGRAIAWFGLFDWPLLAGRRRSRDGARFMEVHEVVMKGLYVLIAPSCAGGAEAPVHRSRQCAAQDDPADPAPTMSPRSGDTPIRRPRR